MINRHHLPLAVYYEHPEWFRPLFAELDRRSIPYVRIDASPQDESVRLAGLSGRHIPLTFSIAVRAGRAVFWGGIITSYLHPRTCREPRQKFSYHRLSRN